MAKKQEDFNFLWSELSAGRIVKGLKYIFKNGFFPGWCPTWGKKTVFIKYGEYLREFFICGRCRSIPRYRAMMAVLEDHFPNWRDLSIHESSPGGQASNKISRECKKYLPTHYYPDVPPGVDKDGFRCENLEEQTFETDSFDLVITQDVFEHIWDTRKAFKEIARTLKPGGCHVFTVPWRYWQPTLLRAKKEGDKVIHLVDYPEYHGNPIDTSGSLVVTDWGWDLCDVIYESSGMTTTVVRINDIKLGIPKAAEFIEVFISRKR